MACKLFGPNLPKSTFYYPHIPKWIDILTFNTFIKFILKFWLKGGLVCENWKLGSGLKAL